MCSLDNNRFCIEPSLRVLRKRRETRSPTCETPSITGRLPPIPAFLTRASTSFQLETRYYRRIRSVFAAEYDPRLQRTRRNLPSGKNRRQTRGRTQITRMHGGRGDEASSGDYYTQRSAALDNYVLRFESRARTDTHVSARAFPPTLGCPLNPPAPELATHSPPPSRPPPPPPPPAIMPDAVASTRASSTASRCGAGVGRRDARRRWRRAGDISPSVGACVVWPSPSSSSNVSCAANVLPALIRRTTSSPAEVVHRDGPRYQGDVCEARATRWNACIYRRREHWPCGRPSEAESGAVTSGLLRVRRKASGGGRSRRATRGRGGRLERARNVSPSSRRPRG